MKIAPALSIAVAIFVGVAGCGSDDDEAPVESRIKNVGSDSYSQRILEPKDLGASDNGKMEHLWEDIKTFPDLMPIDKRPELLRSLSPQDLSSIGGHDVPLGHGGCQSLSDENRGLRSEPPTPQVNVSPWLQSTVSPEGLMSGLDCDLKDDLDGG